jgi:chitin disaccharide deacetylase
MRETIQRVVCLVLLLGFTLCLQAAEIELLVRADDMGAAEAVNVACIKSAKEGIVRSVEVIVPGPWFLHAVKLLTENSEIDVGVHLCLTSEWENVKWRPLTYGPSLVDENGYFKPMTSQRKDFPPNTGFLEGNPKLDEVEKELRAQIETARKYIPRSSHVSVHMGTATSSPQLRALTMKLAQEYGLKLETTNLKGLRGFGGAQKSPVEKISDLKSILEKLETGKWLLVEHPAINTPEMKAIGHKGYYNVAEDREGVLAAFTSAEIKRVIQERGIRLISYADLKKEN